MRRSYSVGLGRRSFLWLAVWVVGIVLAVVSGRWLTLVHLLLRASS